MQSTKRSIIGNNEYVSPPSASHMPEKQLGESDLPDDLLRINIHVGNFKLQQNLKDILYFGQRDIAAESDIEIDKILNASSEFRISVGVAFAYVQQEFDEQEYKFFMYEMQELDEAYKRVVAQRKAVTGKTTQAVLNVTKDERFAELFRYQHVKDTWTKFKQNINALKRDMVILKRVDTALETRTMFLMAISKRRFIERTGHKV